MGKSELARLDAGEIEYVVDEPEQGRKGRQQTRHITMSRAMHGHHGTLPDFDAGDGSGPQPLFPAMPPPDDPLRTAGLGRPIVLFAGALPAGMGEVLAAGLIPTVVDRAGAEAAAGAAAADRPARVYVKVDMGLGRLGVPADEAEAFLAGLAELPGLEVEGLYTHLPFAGWGDFSSRADSDGSLPTFTDS